MERYAVISVHNKDGIVDFARALTQRGLKILSTGGTAKVLRENSIAVTAISDHTQHPEILGGRVKSLHPKIHGGILARREIAQDLAELAANGIPLIDFVVVNLYPFCEKVSEVKCSGDSNHPSLVEEIDIGGPTLIRAAAKNCHHVVPICDPADYPKILDVLKASGEITLEMRQQLAAKVFTMMSAYDGAIARYFSLGEHLLDTNGESHELAPVETYVLERSRDLRYGENPHQQAALYRPYSFPGMEEEMPWKQLQGKELSYNNILDSQAALELLLEIKQERPASYVAVVIKHLNPCGAAERSSLLEAFTAARAGDPVSAFGGIVALSSAVNEETAESILEGFVEVILAPAYESKALELLKKKKNIRVLQCDLGAFGDIFSSPRLMLKNFAADYLVQTSDWALFPVREGNVVTERKPDEHLLSELQFAWQLCKHVKSNTIVITKNAQAIGIGAGQMSRVDAARIAIGRAREHNHDLQGAVAASDAFLPFPDTLEILNDAGVVALVQPGGSIRDEDVIAAANARQVVMIVTGERHFRH